MSERIARITEGMRKLGYLEVGDRSNSGLHFEKTSSKLKKKVSFSIGHIAGLTNEAFEAMMKKFIGERRTV